MEEQDIMNAYYSRTAIEVFRFSRWEKAIPKDVHVGVNGLEAVNLQLLKEDGFPSAITFSIIADDFASKLRQRVVDAS